MKRARALALSFLLVLPACAREDSHATQGGAPESGHKIENGSGRVVSIDFCADQYALSLLDRKDIAALSRDAQKPFSYYRAEADGLPAVRATLEDILLLRPTRVLRSYGGGPGLTARLRGAGIDVVEIGYASDLAAIRATTLRVAAELGAPERGNALIKEMDRRVAALQNAGSGKSDAARILYLTSKGAVAGPGTLIDELISLGGAENFTGNPGWGMVDLEGLASARPGVIAASFFQDDAAMTDRWSPARHDLARRTLRDSRVIEIDGAATACGAPFVIDIAEAIAAAMAHDPHG